MNDKYEYDKDDDDIKLQSPTLLYIDALIPQLILDDQ